MEWYSKKTGSGEVVKITVVTPSFNQGAFIERTIESVLSQRGAFELEYLVIDGGSTDSTPSILRRYAGRLEYLSEPDQGQSDAINKGFARATGEILAWLNSDDLYLPGALDLACRAMHQAHVRWAFGQCRIIDEQDRQIRRVITAYKNRLSRRYSLRRLLTKSFIPQPATFFRRDLLQEVGGLDARYHYAMDYDLWLRFARVAEPEFLPYDLAAFRWHGGSKSGSNYRRVAKEALSVARRHARSGERCALFEHSLHVVSLVAGYQTLDVLEPVLKRFRKGSR